MDSRINPTESQLLDALRSAFSAGDGGEGFTTTELAEQLDWALPKVRAALGRLRREGLIEPTRVLRENLAGVVHPVPGYRLVQQSKAA